MSTSAPVAPPTPQEVSRKLSMSVHNPRPAKLQPASLPPPPVVVAQQQQNQQVSGTESDSDSFLSPDHSPLAPHSPHAHTHAHGHLPAGGALALAGSSSTKALSSIAEKDRDSGDETDDYDFEDAELEGDEDLPQAIENAKRVAGDTVIKTGYLWKKGERRKTWKKRWFVLRPTQLAFYKSSAEYQLLRLLDLSEVHACTPVELKRHAHAFGLVSPARTYYLQAPSERDMREWVVALNKAREALVGTSTQTSIATPPIPIPGGGAGASGSRQAGAAPSMTPSPPSQRPQGGHPVTSESDSDDGLGGSYSGPAIGASPAKGVQAQPQIDPTKTVLSGYLMKCRSKRRGWRKRWFVLTGEKLMYAGNHMDTKRQRCIELNQILDALECDLPSDRHHDGHHSAVGPASPPAHQHGHAHSPHGHSTAHEEAANGDGARPVHAFKIVTTKRSLLLSAPSEEEEIQWLSAVRALIARRSGAGASASSASVAAGPIPPAAGAGASAAKGLAQAGGNAAALGATTGAAGEQALPQSQHVHLQAGSGHTGSSGVKASAVPGRRRSASGNSALTIGLGTPLGATARDKEEGQ